MEYRKFDKKYVVRLDPDEDIVASLREICEKESIHLAEVNGLGALKDFTTVLFDTATKQFISSSFRFPAEITSLWGLITTKNGEFYPHIHMSCGDIRGNVYGGHLSSATVSATAELVISTMDGTVEREMNEEIGLNLLKFI